MKKKVFWLSLSLFVLFACSRTPEEKGTGYLTLNISQSTGSKADVDITGFILQISEGQINLVKGRIGDLPAEIALPAGTYTIEAYSMEFDIPKFETPFYSGKTTVEIEAGETKEASLVCSQGNAGIKVIWANSFATLYSTYYAQIYCDADNYLHYSSTEERMGYFLPGTVSVIIHADGQTINSGTITLAAKDMVTAYLRPKNDDSPSGGLTIEISIDDVVNEREVEVIVDPVYSGLNSETNPYSISEAITRQGENGVWITGYIVGAKPSSGYDYVNGVWLSSNIVLADNIDETDDRNVIIVQLTGSDLRPVLNVVDNPENLHQQVVIKGNLMSYLSRAGLQNISNYSFP